MIEKSLFDGLTPLGELPVLRGAGIYIFALRPEAILPGIEPGDRGLLYLGMTDQSLDVRNHFLHADSGRSTLRRSLGALLLDVLELEPIPRGQGRSDRDVTNYRFAGAGEARLTGWMGEKLLACQQQVSGDVRGQEKALIDALGPPLNLTDWPNPQKSVTDAARRRCRERARAALAAR